MALTHPIRLFTCHRVCFPTEGWRLGLMTRDTKIFCAVTVTVTVPALWAQTMSKLKTCSLVIWYLVLASTPAVISITPSILSKGLRGSNFLSRKILSTLNRMKPASSKTSTSLCAWKGKRTWPLPRLHTQPIIEEDPGMRSVLDLLLWIFFSAAISQDR